MGEWDRRGVESRVDHADPIEPVLFGTGRPGVGAGRPMWGRVLRVEAQSADEVAGEHASGSLSRTQTDPGADTRSADFVQLVDLIPGTRRPQVTRSGS